MFLKSKLSIVSKICLSGLFIALAIIFQKVVAINNIIPFLRISFGGPAIIIFSSILLGPWFGLLVGAGSDLLGYFVLDPNPFLWQITLLYGFLGFASYFIFNFLRKLRTKNGTSILILIIELVMLAIACLIMFVSPNINIDKLWVKIVLCVSGLILIIINYIIFKFLCKKVTLDFVGVDCVSISMFVIEIIVMVILGSVLKNWAFMLDNPFPILLTQVLVAFFNIPLNTVLIIIFLKITQKYFLDNNSEKNK